MYILSKTSQCVLSYTTKRTDALELDLNPNMNMYLVCLFVTPLIWLIHSSFKLVPLSWH